MFKKNKNIRHSKLVAFVCEHLPVKKDAYAVHIKYNKNLFGLMKIAQKNPQSSRWSTLAVIQTHHGPK